MGQPVDAHKAVVERACGAALAFVELLEAVVGVRHTGIIISIVNVVPHFGSLQGQDKVLRNCLERRTIYHKVSKDKRYS